MNDVPIKNTGDQYTAAEHNPHHTELETAVTSTGDSLGGDNSQLSRAMATYANGADYYTESGSANAYICSPVGSKLAPHAYFVGMRVRFRTANANTGASTVNVNSLGVKNIKKADGSSDPDADDINVRGDTILVYDGTNFRLPLSELNLPKLHISIFTENDSTDPAKDIKFKAGKARDIADTFDINLQADMIKQLDAVWVAGTGNGGRASGVALSANTTYHFFVIAKPDGTADAGFDTALNATNLLADATGYTKYRRVGSMKTDGSSNWLTYNQLLNWFTYKVRHIDVSLTTVTNSKTAISLTIPSGLELIAKINASIDDSVELTVFLFPNGYEDFAVLEGGTTTPAATRNLRAIAGGENNEMQLLTNTSSQIFYRASQTTADSFVINTMGFYDPFIA
jgi:hypothetical protein